MNETITSRQNAWFKRVSRAVREHGEEIVIEGPKQVADAIASGWRPLAIVRSEVAAGRSQETDVVFAETLFKALADTKTSQGVLALFERPRYTIDDVLARRDTIAVALDGVQDPGNVGTIVRLAAAFDAAGVILLPGCADAFSPKAIRASAGAVLRVPVAAATLSDLATHNRPMLYADAAGDAISPPPDNAILIFGSEGSGVSDPIRGAAKPIAIAMSDRVESLNVAAAAAILLSRSYESRSRS
ncbi:MAG: TrmH family RNA methyltransferase [Thermoanaerobaculia bacterium]